MPSVFYECAGEVTASVADPSALLCSSGWLAVSEPTFQLVTQEQAGDLIIAFLLLVALWKVFQLILSVMGVRP